MQLRGIGPTTASALLAAIGAGHDFRNGRQVATWIGLTPGQYSSGGKARLGSITKAGDAYLRGLLVNGALAVIANLGEKQDRFSRWVRTLIERRGYWRAAIAIAAKNASIDWIFRQIRLAIIRDTIPTRLAGPRTAIYSDECVAKR